LVFPNDFTKAYRKAQEEIVSVNGIKTPTWRETMETLFASAMDAEEGLPIQVKTHYFFIFNNTFRC
jgi:regulator of sigma E protease